MTNDAPTPGLADMLANDRAAQIAPAKNRKVRGFGIRLSTNDTGAFVGADPIEISPVLYAEQTIIAPSGRRLFGCVEHWAEDAAPSRGRARAAVDLLCVDHGTREFVIKAVEEKITREKGSRWWREFWPLSSKCGPGVPR